MSRPDPDPIALSDAALRCAFNACKASQWASDRQFADACRRETERRQALAKGALPARQVSRPEGVPA